MSLLVVSVPGDKSAGLLALAGHARNLRVTELSYRTAASKPIDPAWIAPGTRAILRDPWRKGARYQDTQHRLLAALSPGSVLDEVTLRELPDHEDKLVQSRLFDGEVPALESWPASQPYEGPFPVVLKRRIASGGRGTFLVRSEEQLRARLRAEDPAGCLLQTYVALDADYRILILGSQVIAAVSRRIRVHEEGSSARLAVKVDAPVPLPDAFLEDAMRVAQIFRCDFCGVDIIKSKGRHYVIECNLSPQFRSTEKLIGRDVAGEVIDFLMDKSPA